MKQPRAPPGSDPLLRKNRRKETMKIRIIMPVPTINSPKVGEVYEVTRTEVRSPGVIYFVMCEGEEVGVLSHEMEVVEK